MGFQGIIFNNIKYTWLPSISVVVNRPEKMKGMQHTHVYTIYDYFKISESLNVKLIIQTFAIEQMMKFSTGE